jgi:hypothetical protein
MSEQSAPSTERGLEKFDTAIVEDRGPGIEVLQTVKREADADQVLRLTESQCEALIEYDRAIATTRDGSRVVVEMLPDEFDDRIKPVEIRSVEPETDGGQDDE